VAVVSVRFGWYVTWYKTGVSNSRPAGRMRPAKALIAARDTLSKILIKINRFIYFIAFFLVIQQNYYFSHLRSH